MYSKRFMILPSRRCSAFLEASFYYMVLGLYILKPVRKRITVITSDLTSLPYTMSNFERLFIFFPNATRDNKIIIVYCEREDVVRVAHVEFRRYYNMYTDYCICNIIIIISL